MTNTTATTTFTREQAKAAEVKAELVAKAEKKAKKTLAS